MATPLPVLGFREWVLRSDGTLAGIRGDPWPGAAIEASCDAGHPAPADDCTCGVYAIDDWPRIGDHRLYQEASAPLRMAAQGILIATALGGVALLALMERGMIGRATWMAAALVAAPMAIGLAAMVAVVVALMRPRHMLGAVLLTGRVLRYRNGVMRAEHARVACLVRPIGVRRRVAGDVAKRLGVPLFGWHERRRAMSYLSEHGDVWARSFAGRRGEA